jgi:hypothetical protein
VNGQKLAADHNADGADEVLSDVDAGIVFKDGVDDRELLLERSQRH